MARTPAPARGRRPYIIEDSSDDEETTPPPRRPPLGSRLTGGAARSAGTRGRTSAPRGRQSAAVAGAGRNTRRNGSNATARRGGAGPIVGGHQNQRRRLVNGLISGNGHAYRVGRRRVDDNAGNVSSGTIVLNDSIEDEDEEGDDVDSFIASDDDEHLNEYDLEDSFINDESGLDGHHFGFDLSDEEDDDLVEREENAGWRGRGRGRADETFSQEVEEFELMEERESAATRKAEERLRKKEDKEEKENRHALRTDMFGACTVCAEDEVTDPVGCIYCSGFIGCRKCANRWYRTSKGNDPEKIASCPLCRHKWPSTVPEVGDMLDLVKCA